MFISNEYNKIKIEIGGNKMLASYDMLDLLSKINDDEPYQNHNDDEDFGKVLEECQDDKLTGHKLRCSDGKERVFSFED